MGAMSLGLRESRNFERRRRRRRMVKWLFVMGAIGSLGVMSYRSGSALAQREVTRLRGEVDRLSAEVASLQDRNTRALATAEAARMREADLRKRYDKEVPTGRLRELLTHIQAAMSKGLDVDRIAFVIDAATHPRSCDAKPVTKRFLVRTPLYQGANVAVGFADGSITVTAEGEAATNGQGKIEAWFDPAKPVTARFIRLGGATTTAIGALPLHQSVVRGKNEYRFSVLAADQRGFVTVTAERCDFP